MLAEGHRIGSYVVIAPLGAGGMGEVYLAEDTRLRRRVALKILPPLLASDERARTRLLVEAQSVAALDHPNICTVYEAGEADGHRFIAMQYIEGETLAARIRRRPLEPAAAVTMATQVAQALAEAHRRGIIHRDVKPQNIMLSESGHVRVLDFGLAKATTATQGDAETTPVLTEAGVVAGTVPYMSPEQARGEPLDERSDIFSFGTVLYETVAGRHPFGGASSADTMSRLLLRDPPPLDASVPSELQRIILKCLEKDRTRRYQTVRDLAVDLESTTRHVASDAVRARSRRTGRGVWIGAAAIVLAAAAAVWWLTQQTSPPAIAGEFEQVTAFADAASAPVLSPDGRMVAFIRDANPFLTRGDIYVKLLPNGDALRLTNDPRPKYGLAFSPDGSRIAYTVLGTGDDLWSTWTVPVLGGQAPTRLLPNASGLTWIDDRHVLFSEVEGGDLHMGVVTASETRQDRRVIYFPEHERAMVHYSALSPDRQWVLTVEMNKTGGWERCRVLPFDGRSAGRLVGPEGPCRSAAWSPDGQWMYFAAEIGGASHLWRERFPNGTAEAITSNPATDEEGVTVAPDGRSIITSVGRRGTSLWLHDAQGDRLITSEGFATRPRFSSDGKRVYCLLQKNAASARLALAAVDLDTGRTEQLLSDFSVTQYHVSPDDRDVAFTTAGRNDVSEIWIAALDRRAPPRRLVENADRVFFGAGDELLFRALEGHANHLDRINRDGSGRARVLPTPIVDFNGVSPDGEWAVVNSSVVEIRRGRIHPLCDGPCFTAWSPDGRFLSVISSPGATGGESIIVPLARGQMFPTFPADDSPARPAWLHLPDVRRIDRAAIPGSDGVTYLFTKADDVRNLYRVPLR